MWWATEGSLNVRRTAVLLITLFGQVTPVLIPPANNVSWNARPDAVSYPHKTKYL